MGGLCDHPKLITDPEAQLFKHIKVLRDKRCLVFWVIGASGTGKTQMSKILARQYRFRHIEIAKLLYTIVAHDDWVPEVPDPTRASNITKTNYLVERKLLFSAVLHEMLTYAHCSRGFILDGFPRHVEQGIEFMKRICPLTFILYFKMSERGLKRVIRLQNEKIHRIDDYSWEDMARERLRSFHRFVPPILKHFEKYVLTINMDRPWNQITSDLMDTLDDYLTTRGMDVPVRYYDVSSDSSEDETPRPPGPKFVKRDRKNLAKTPHPRKKKMDLFKLKHPPTRPPGMAPERTAFGQVYAKQIAEELERQKKPPKNMAHRIIPKSKRRKFASRSSSVSFAHSSNRSSPRISPAISNGSGNFQFSPTRAGPMKLSPRAASPVDYNVAPGMNHVVSIRSNPGITARHEDNSPRRNHPQLHGPEQEPEVKPRPVWNGKSNFALFPNKPTIVRKNVTRVRRNSYVRRSRIQDDRDIINRLNKNKANNSGSPARSTGSGTGVSPTRSTETAHQVIPAPKAAPGRYVAYSRGAEAGAGLSLSPNPTAGNNGRRASSGSSRRASAASDRRASTTSGRRASTASGRRASTASGRRGSTGSGRHAAYTKRASLTVMQANSQLALDLAANNSPKREGPFVRRPSEMAGRSTPSPNTSIGKGKKPKYAPMYPPARRSSYLRVPGHNPKVIRRLPGAEGSHRSYVRRGTGVGPINFALGHGPPPGEIPKIQVTAPPQRLPRPKSQVSATIEEGLRAAKEGRSTVVYRSKDPSKNHSIHRDALAHKKKE